MRARLSMLITAASISACGVPIIEETPFVMAPDSVFGKVRTVVVTPVTTPGEITIPESAAAKLEATLEKFLRKAGFSVVPSFEYLGSWQHIADEVGGFYDTHTGARDEALFDAATKRLVSELSERFQVDALLYPELWGGAVPFYDGVATWDGASQAVFGAYGLSGMVKALSLIVVLEDTAGTELFSNGIGFATVEAWRNHSWLPMALDGVVGDPRLATKAVTGVLAPLFEALKTDSSVSP